MKKFLTSFWFIWVLALIITGIISYLLCKFFPVNDYYILRNDMVNMDWLIVGLVFSIVLIVVMNLIVYVKKIFGR